MRRLWHRNRHNEDVPPQTDALRQASSSDSNTSRSTRALEPKHKIFSSHSGAQKDFVEQSCVDLERWNCHPFFDIRWDSLPKGKKVPPLIFEVIEQCQVGVVILLEKYFTQTKWPMLELVAMADRNDKEFTIIPVFLNISLAQCRDPTKHAQWRRVWKKWAKVDKRIDIDKWKKVLSLFGSTNAFVYKDGTSKVKFREDIVEGICKHVRPETRWDDSNIKGKARICKDIQQKIENIDVSENYRIVVVGLYGMGGIGKTTACKVLCNDYWTELQGRVCHVEFGSGSQLELFRKALSKLTDVTHEVLERLDEGECRDLLKRNSHSHRVFLAIDNVSDNVDSIEQARAFLNAGFKSGSMVVVTAHSLGQLKYLSISESDCMEMPELEVEEARLLFLSQVIGVPVTIPGNDEKHVMSCVEHCYFSKGMGAVDTTILWL